MKDNSLFITCADDFKLITSFRAAFIDFKESGVYLHDGDFFGKVYIFRDLDLFLSWLFLNLD